MTRASDERTEARRILLVAQFYWPEPTGSAPVVTNVAEWLAGRGYAVEVLTTRPHYPEGRVWPAYRSGAHDLETRHGVRIRRVPTFPARGTGLFGRIWSEGLFFAYAVIGLVRQPRARSCCRCARPC